MFVAPAYPTRTRVASSACARRAPSIGPRPASSTAIVRPPPGLRRAASWRTLFPGGWGLRRAALNCDRRLVRPRCRQGTEPGRVPEVLARSSRSRTDGHRGLSSRYGLFLTAALSRAGPALFHHRREPSGAQRSSGSPPRAGVDAQARRRPVVSYRA